MRQIGCPARGHDVGHIRLGIPDKPAVAAAGCFRAAAARLLAAQAALADQRPHGNAPAFLMPRAAGVLNADNGRVGCGRRFGQQVVQIFPEGTEPGIRQGPGQRVQTGGAGHNQLRLAEGFPVGAQPRGMFVKKGRIARPEGGNAAAGKHDAHAAVETFAQEAPDAQNLRTARRRKLTAGEEEARTASGCGIGTADGAFRPGSLRHVLKGEFVG